MAHSAAMPAPTAATAAKPRAESLGQASKRPSHQHIAASIGDDVDNGFCFEARLSVDSGKKHFTSRSGDRVVTGAPDTCSAITAPRNGENCDNNQARANHARGSMQSYRHAKSSHKSPCREQSHSDGQYVDRSDPSAPRSLFAPRG